MKSKHQKNLLKKAIINCLSGNAIFADLDSTELNIISEHTHVSRFKPGDIVFAEGDPGDEVSFVVDGTLDVLKIKSGEVEKKIAIKSPGGSIGEMAVIGGFSRTATVKARTDVPCLPFPADASIRSVTSIPSSASKSCGPSPEFSACICATPPRSYRKFCLIRIVPIQK